MEPSLDLSIAQKASESLELFKRLLQTQQHQEQQYLIDEISEDAIVDALARFRTWADNLGGLRRGEASLDHRLRHADIRVEVLRLLGQLLFNLDDLWQILSGHRIQQTWTTSDETAFQEFSDIEDSDEDEIDQQTATSCSSGESSRVTSESQLLYQSVLESITSLLKLSMFIRKSTRGNRFAKSSKAQKYETQYDIIHVRDRFPFAANHPFVIERLGKANAQRRQWLSYKKRHREKLAMSASPMHETPFRSELLSDSEMELNSRATIEEDYLRSSVWSGEHKQSSTMLSSTKASTFFQGQIPEEDVAENEHSETSYSETRFGDDGQETNLVPQPPPESANENPFECPYCFSIIVINGIRSWRKHVHSDLASYLCTQDHCSHPLFDSRNQWFNHELEEHRRQWVCGNCETALHSVRLFKGHMMKHHPGTFLESQLTALASRSARPLERINASACPLCDYEAVVRRKLETDTETESITVSIRTFRNHLGRHLEQLALFVLPKVELIEQASDAVTTNAANDGEIALSADGRDTDVSDIIADEHEADKKFSQSSPDLPGDELISLDAGVDELVGGTVSASLDDRGMINALGFDDLLENSASAPDLAFTWMPPMDFTPPQANFEVDDDDLVPRREEPMFGGDIFTPGWEHGSPGLDQTPKYTQSSSVKPIQELLDLNESIRMGTVLKFESNLIRRPQLVSSKDASGRTPLHYAAELGDVSFMEHMLKSCQGQGNIADIHRFANFRSVNGQTPLMLAAAQGHKEAAEWLIANHADINAIDINGFTALDEAAEAGFSELAKLLILKKADIHQAKVYHQMKLRDIARGRTKVVSAQDHGSIPGKNTTITTPDMPVLHQVILQGDAKIIHDTLAKGVDVEEFSRDGQTPLMLAASGGKHEVIEILASSGANMNATSAKGWTTLMYAVRNKDALTVRHLISYGADVNHLSPDRWTALAEAAYQGQKAIIKMLLDCGADTESRSSHDWTPLMHATYKGDMEAVRLLLDAGADMEVTSDHDETTILLAAASRHDSITRLLLEAGCEPEPAWAKGPNDTSEDGIEQAKSKAIGEPEDRAHARGWTPLMLASQGGAPRDSCDATASRCQC